MQLIKAADDQYALKQSHEMFKKHVELKTRLDPLTT